MKYILIISAVFIASCGQPEQQQKVQTEQVNRSNSETSKTIALLIQERDAKIKALVSAGKNDEAAAVGREYIRKRDSVMRIKY